MLPYISPSEEDLEFTSRNYSMWSWGTDQNPCQEANGLEGKSAVF